jgi:hypothetical protein
VGTHLFCPEHAGVVPVQVHAWSIAENSDPLAVLQEKLDQRKQWIAGLQRQEAKPAGDPLALAVVVRVYNEGKQVIDLRTGLVYEETPKVPEVVLAGLPLPSEVRAAR